MLKKLMQLDDYLDKNPKTRNVIIFVSSILLFIFLPNDIFESYEKWKWNKKLNRGIEYFTSQKYAQAKHTFENLPKRKDELEKVPLYWQAKCHFVNEDFDSAEYLIVKKIFMPHRLDKTSKFSFDIGNSNLSLKAFQLLDSIYEIQKDYDNLLHAKNGVLKSAIAESNFEITQNKAKEILDILLEKDLFFEAFSFIASYQNELNNSIYNGEMTGKLLFDFFSNNNISFLKSFEELNGLPIWEFENFPFMKEFYIDSFEVTANELFSEIPNLLEFDFEEFIFLKGEKN